jgi:hypothetical protein
MGCDRSEPGLRRRRNEYLTDRFSKHPVFRSKWSDIMTKFTAALFALGAIITVGLPAEASARDYPYCLQGDQWGYPGNCQFTSYQQCMATASGTLSSCGINPRAAYGMEQEPRRRYRHSDRW